ncbi:hypothetical protein N7510_011281 [Penicillium lagena]|uniref:uncharacterized protein n=1 Tax=Penicillium lagena TaxID=94218 RepID=UPI002541A6C0|nr:uncharacterized protein N7510_011281 [Penicillium lagena]KAJ5601747.1 hypothetical protein N7510_011281 [Penicillium lagena]
MESSSEYMPETSERGSLTAHSNDDSHFVGSSSGVYFINTVKQAFSGSLDASGQSGTGFPTAEDTLLGADDSPHTHHSSSKVDSTSPDGLGESPLQWTYDPTVVAVLGSAPPLDLAKELMMMYFKVWHPLFPFLHGPTFLQAMERLYAGPNSGLTTAKSTSDHRSACWTTIFQCVFNLASLLRSDLDLPTQCTIPSPSSINPLLGSLSSRHDIPSFQALLATQVYLVATMSLRPASTVGGCILRSMLHAGLHRCPFRYRELSSHDRHLRKRIFWCAYAIDRYLSQALGLPLGIQDSDIDVCLPAAREIHSSRHQRGIPYNAQQYLIPDDCQAYGQIDPYNAPIGTMRNEHKNQSVKENILASYVDSGTLTGRALEIFHKSLLVRSVPRKSVLFLVTDVHKWWNSLPLDLLGKSTGQHTLSPADSPFDFGPFFTVLYQHLILLINRPSLSLEPTTAEFCSGLQTCIGAARSILAALKAQTDSRQALFWPGFLSAAWMSGLVLAFACQLKQYALEKALQEISECLEYLKVMSVQWETAKHCFMALSLLLTKIKERESDADEREYPHPYAIRYLERPPTSFDRSDERGQRKRKNSDDTQSNTNPSTQVPGSSGRETERLHPALAASRQTDFSRDRPSKSQSLSAESAQSRDMNSATASLSAETPLSLEMRFPSLANDNVTGESNFDLNMVDLLDGANFDSLFDLIGQQYPSF